ncbi:MAG: diacylglycerol kinase, partial [Proteobacteria bacterium]
MKRFLMGFVYAGRGMAAAWSGQTNIKVMLAGAVAACSLGWRLGISRAEWGVVLVACGLVMGLELMNTAGEKLVDILSPEHDPRYGRVKDILAGAVLVAAIGAA